MKKAILGVVCFFAASCLLNAQDVNLPEGYQIIESSSPYTMVLTPYTTYPVLLQKYVPVNLFEGKWGSKPGEFGLKYTEVADEHRPMSLAVNSKNEIYILDVVNNRIQKFTPEGQYIKSISVRSFCDKDGVKPAEASWSHAPYYNGVAIEIDSKDSLYYYLFKGESWPVKKAELWEFRDDVLVKKWDVLPSGEFAITPKDELMIYSYNKKTERTEQFNIRTQSSEEWSENKISLPWFDIYFDEDDYNDMLAKLIMINPQSQAITKEYQYVPIVKYANVWIGKQAYLLKDSFYVRHTWLNKADSIIFSDEFDKNGTLLSTTLIPVGIDLPRATYDQIGNIYELVKTGHGIMVKKWIVKKHRIK